MELGIEPNTADLRTLIGLVGGGEKGVVQVSFVNLEMPEGAVDLSVTIDMSLILFLLLHGSQ